MKGRATEYKSTEHATNQYTRLAVWRLQDVLQSKERSGHVVTDMKEETY